ncbi:MAG: AAA family ATPase [Candidatus Acidiferrales bacterium]
MYRKFYGLSRNPFEISPDPYFFYPTPRHNEALANLNYGVQRRKGVVVVTGEVGTGKTLLVRCLLDSLNRNQIAFAYVFNPRLSVPDFLRYMLTDLRLPMNGRTKSEMLAYLNSYLIARFRRGTTAVLVVDEAQLLSWELLEEIRLLTNLETSQQKLLQIVLVGQPELDRRLDSPHLRQLKQRVGLRCSLEPLGVDELKGYILRRLELAGANSHGGSIFTEEAIAAVHRYSRGIPRLINTLCENSLVSGYAKQAKQITEDMVHEVAADFRLDAPTAVPAAGIEDPESRKRALKALFRMIEDLDSGSGKPNDETSLESGVKAE